MRKILLFVFLIASISLAGLKAFNNQSVIESFVRDNIEALTDGDFNQQWYEVTRYELAKKYQITKLSAYLSSYYVNMIFQNDNYLQQFVCYATQCNVEYTIELVDCHRRVCVETTIPQYIMCPGTQDYFEVCSSYCDHSNNQI